MADKRALISIEIDSQQYAGEVEKLEKDLLGLRDRQRELNKAVKAGEISQEDYAKEIIKVKGEIKETSTNQREAVKLAKAEKGSLNALKAELSKLTKQRNATNQSTEKGVKAAAALDDEIGELTKRLKQNEEAGGDFRRNVGNYSSALKGAAANTTVLGVNLGQAATAFSTANSAVLGTNKALNLFKIALVSTGIGAIVVALGTLITAFNKTQQGADLLSQVMSGVGTAIDVIVDRISSVGGAIIELARGNISLSEAFDQIKQAGTGVFKEINDEVRTGIELTKQEQQLQRDKIAFLTEEAALRNKIEFLRTEGENRALSAAQRQQSLNEALELVNVLNEKQVGFKERELEILKEQQALGNNLLEDDRAAAQLAADLIDLRAAAQETNRTINSQVNAAREEQNRESLKIQQEDELRIARETAQLKKDQLAISSIEREGSSDIDNPETQLAFRNAEEVIAIQQRAANTIVDIKKRRAKQENAIEKAVQEFKLGAIASTLGNISSLFEEQSIAHRVLASTEAGINAWLAFSNALATTPLPPPFPQIAAGAALASGLAAVAKINGISFGGGGSSGGGATGSIPRAAPPPNRSFLNNALTTPSNAALRSANSAQQSSDIANANANIPAPKVSVVEIVEETQGYNAKIDVTNI